ncbi:MAG: response regulator transcription factor [Acidimicrobiia bacterium]|nr:response regulator transcription factor [Acidimicrobiia bacterium]
MLPVRPTVVTPGSYRRGAPWPSSRVSPPDEEVFRQGEVAAPVEQPEIEGDPNGSHRGSRPGGDGRGLPGPGERTEWAQGPVSLRALSAPLPGRGTGHLRVLYETVSQSLRRGDCTVEVWWACDTDGAHLEVTTDRRRLRPRRRCSSWVVGPGLAGVGGGDRGNADDRRAERGHLAASLLRSPSQGLPVTANIEVAERLFISQKTVKNHLASIYHKLDARDRTEAVLRAVRMGIVRLD